MARVMSRSMWVWRVVLPGGGLAFSLLVLWASLQAADKPRGNGSGSATDSPRPTRDRRAKVERIMAEGRVVARPGAEVTVGTEAGGLVVDLPARVKMRVKKGDLLIRFRSVEQEAILAEAQAKLAEADAEVEFQKREFQRRAKSPLDSKHYASDVDAGRRDYELASARRKAAVAVIEQCRSALEQTRVTAPIDGVVLACLVQNGEVAPAGARLVTVCDLTRTRIEAEVDEFDAQRVCLGAEVSVTVEGSSSTAWRGTVEEIPDAVSGRTIRPDDPGRPTDTAVLLVKIAMETPIPLKLGQQVEVEILPPATADSTP